MASSHPSAPLPEGDPGPCGPGVESKASRPVRRNLPFPVLATRPLDGCRRGRPSAGQRGRSAALLPLGHTSRVLERPVGEGLRQVRTLQDFSPRGTGVNHSGNLSGYSPG